MSKTAGKPKNAVWRNTTRKGKRVTVSPDGRIYFGTSKEVRDAALSPSRRNALSSMIRLKRLSKSLTPGELRELIREERRRAISWRDMDARSVQWHVPMTESDYILLNAGARLLGLSSYEYWADVIRSQKAALIDAAFRFTGKREIPLTRYERAALARLATMQKAGKTA